MCMFVIKRLFVILNFHSTNTAGHFKSTASMTRTVIFISLINAYVYIFVRVTMYLSYLEKILKTTATRISEQIFASFFGPDVGNQLPGCRLFSRCSIYIFIQVYMYTCPNVCRNLCSIHHVCMFICFYLH